MRYRGSKRLYAKHIIPLIMGFYKDGMSYYEPFIGGANLFHKIDIKNKVGSDLSKYAIEALKFIRDNPESIPKNNKEYTKERYLKARTLENLEPVDNLALFQYSFGGNFNSIWAKSSDGADYVREGYRGLVEQSKGLQNSVLINCHYDEIEYTKEPAIIYCDPPYNGSRQDCYSTEKFDSPKFYTWCESMSGKGHTVLVSEYSAPSYWKCLWSKEVSCTVDQYKTAGTRTEKLYLARSK